MYAKKEHFDEQQQQVALYAKLLSHPARVAILQLLASKNTCIAGDISDELPLSRTTVSQHLQELKAAGIIKGEIDGVKVCYCINHEVLNKIQSNISVFFQDIQNSIKCNC